MSRTRPTAEGRTGTGPQPPVSLASEDGNMEDSCPGAYKVETYPPGAQSGLHVLGHPSELHTGTAQRQRQGPCKALCLFCNVYFPGLIFPTWRPGGDKLPASLPSL